ncbi:MAG TPA: M20/M25/M40 family metallo-hydrolase [Candidatus Cloacimonadota bacterium]|nr:M20/M25/M40 family metallo-hydrolase [Candidatus Cloacimonadota bacterium]
MQTDVVKYFMELVAIDSESKNERAIADRIMADLISLGAQVYEDDAHKHTGGNAGSVYAWFDGDPSKTAILFCAHLDTVKPGNGIKALITDGRIHTDGTTILGGDDKSGVVEIMAGIQRVLASGASHAPIEVLFTISEEIGLLGAKLFDKSKLKARMGYALDTHRVGELVLAAPSQNSIRICVNGVEAHAGVEPEKGINAIRVASEAIASMPMGRIDHETTCNIGVISGGIATNIVPNQVIIRGEARSHNMAKLEQVSSDIRHAVEAAVKRHHFSQGSATYDWQCKREYDAFHIGEDEPVVKLAKAALAELGIECDAISGGGGSDANIINAAGIPTIICGTGMNKVHTVHEDLLVSELERGTCFIESLINIHSR